MSEFRQSAFFEKFGERLFRYRIKYAGSPKKFALKMAAWLVFRSMFFFGKKTASPSGALKIAAVVSGGVGDFVLAARALRRISEIPKTPFSFDVYYSHPDVAEGVLAGEKFVSKIVGSRKPPSAEDYDAVIEISRVPVFIHISRRLSKGFPDAGFADYAKRISAAVEKNPHFAQSGVLFDNTSIAHAQIAGRKRPNQADIDGSLDLDGGSFKIECTPDASDTVASFGLEPFGYITVQRGAKNVRDETKLWPLEYYCELVILIRAKFPHLKIVQLGAASARDIPNVHADLRGKTSFEQLKALLKFSRLHIDGECGMVHLKHFIGGTSAVLFGPTDMDFYAYPENINIAAGVCRPCEWVVSDWSEKCARGGCVAPCMASISPLRAFAEIAKFLRGCDSIEVRGNCALS